METWKFRERERESRCWYRECAAFDATEHECLTIFERIMEQDSIDNRFALSAGFLTLFVVKMGHCMYYVSSLKRDGGKIKIIEKIYRAEVNRADFVYNISAA